MPSQSLLPEVWSVPQEFRDRLGEDHNMLGNARIELAYEHLATSSGRFPINVFYRIARAIFTDPGRSRRVVPQRLT